MKNHRGRKEQSRTVQKNFVPTVRLRMNGNNCWQTSENKFKENVTNRNKKKYLKSIQTKIKMAFTN